MSQEKKDKFLVHTFNHNFRIKMRPTSLPWSWVCITRHPGGLTYAQRRDWQLVLDSRAIPCRSIKLHGEELLYVAPVEVFLAEAELKAFIKENRPRKSVRKFPTHKDAWQILFFLLLLVLFYCLQKGIFFDPPLKNEDWVKAGALDNIDFKYAHQWSRAVTALTLHANISHLMDNLLFGGIFLYLLARVIGAGKAILYTIIGGIAGNILSACARSYPVVSLGFSTAVFASAGILAGVMTWEDKRKAMLPLAGAAGILALLGVGGDNTDYIAHICGLIAGLSIGVIFVWLSEILKFIAMPQYLAGCAAVMIIFIAWLFALAG